MTILSSKQLFVTILSIVGTLYALIFRCAACQETQYQEQTKQTHFQAEQTHSQAESEKATAEIAKTTLERERLLDQQRKAKP